MTYLLKAKKIALLLMSISMLALISVFIYSLIFLDGFYLKLASLIAIVFLLYYFVRGVVYIHTSREDK